MIDDDPFAPPLKKTLPLSVELENASIGDIQARIERLKAEIVQCEAAIAAKQAQRAAADSVFGGRGS